MSQSRAGTALKANEPRHRASSVACDFPLRRGRPGGAVFFFPAAVHDNRHDFHIRRATWHAKTRRGVTARISWLDFCRNRFVFVFTRDRDGDLYFDRRSMPFPPQMLLVRPRHGVHRMSFHSFRNNSRSLHDRRAFAGICEDFVLNRISTALESAVRSELPWGPCFHMPRRLERCRSKRCAEDSAHYSIFNGL